MEELEGLLGPEDVDVDFRRILKEARDERGRKIFETFSSTTSWWLSGRDGTSTKEHHGKQDSSASARDGWWQASLGQSQELTIVGWSQDE